MRKNLDIENMMMVGLLVSMTVNRQPNLFCTEEYGQDFGQSLLGIWRHLLTVFLCLYHHIHTNIYTNR